MNEDFKVDVNVALVTDLITTVANTLILGG